ncbi:MAG: DUF1697 domain-containing protein [Flavobacteriaceae bacterium]
MPVYIALLRGINVGGHRKIIMADLRIHFENWGFKDVQTYIQSGNIVFSSEVTKVEQLADRIKSGILDVYGFEIAVWVADRRDFNRIALKNPYGDMDEADRKVYFVFLTHRASADRITRLKSIEFDNEEFTISNECIYLHCRNGYGKARCNNVFIETALKVNTTARNFRTVNKLIELVG